MKRVKRQPRSNWQNIVQEQGLLYHTPEGRTYWDESVNYELEMAEVKMIEKATEELYQLYLAAAEHIIERDRFGDLEIPEVAIPYIKAHWDSEPPSLYGRFDLAFDGDQLKLLEFNADTPTTLVEAAVVQWYWAKDVAPSSDQFNSLHEKLIEKWKDIRASVGDEIVHFCHMDDWEDWMTIAYLRDTAAQGGISSGALLMNELGWNSQDGTLRNLEDQVIAHCFKLYPWEWLIREVPQEHVGSFLKVRWIEPIWKMLWSNKAMLAILWELNPGHPFLLETHLQSPGMLREWVSKPYLSREGANVTVQSKEFLSATEGPYSDGSRVYQAKASIPCFDGAYPVVGSWYITDQGPAGVGIREADSIVTDNLSRFVPHLIR